MKKGLVAILVAGALLASCGQNTETPAENGDVKNPAVEVEATGENGEKVEVKVTPAPEAGETVVPATELTPAEEVEAAADAEAVVDAVEAAVEAGEEAKEEVK